MTLLFLRVLNKIKLLQYLILNVSANIYGKRFSIPIVKGIGLKNIYTTETWMVKLIGQLLDQKKQPTFVDVGVNIGQTLLKVKSIDRNINYVGFEPNPSALFYVNELIKTNKLESTSSIFPVGISEQTDLLTLNIYNKSDVDSSASILDEFRPNEKILEKKNIAVFNLEESKNVKTQLKQIDILKIDVEGAELEVLKSMANLIRKYQPYILIEILPVYSEKNEYRIERQNQIEMLLRELNYTILRIVKSSSKSEAEGFEDINEFGIHADMNQCDYVFMPSSKIDEFKKATA